MWQIIAMWTLLSLKKCHRDKFGPSDSQQQYNYFELWKCPKSLFQAWLIGVRNTCQHISTHRQNRVKENCLRKTACYVIYLVRQATNSHCSERWSVNWEPQKYNISIPQNTRQSWVFPCNNIASMWFIKVYSVKIWKFTAFIAFTLSV